MRLKRSEIFLICVFVASFVGALATNLAETRGLTSIVGAPALILSGLAFFGHFITLDDEMPGEWSNPNGSHTVWYRSLAVLLVKFFVFALAAIACFWNS